MDPPLPSPLPPPTCFSALLLLLDAAAAAATVSAAIAGTREADPPLPPSFLPSSCSSLPSVKRDPHINQTGDEVLPTPVPLTFILNIADPPPLRLPSLPLSPLLPLRLEKRKPQAHLKLGVVFQLVYLSLITSLMPHPPSPPPSNGNPERNSGWE